MPMVRSGRVPQAHALDAFSEPSVLPRDAPPPRESFARMWSWARSDRMYGACTIGIRPIARLAVFGNDQPLGLWLPGVSGLIPLGQRVSRAREARGAAARASTGGTRPGKDALHRVDGGVVRPASGLVNAGSRRQSRTGAWKRSGCGLLGASPQALRASAGRTNERGDRRRARCRCGGLSPPPEG